MEKNRIIITCAKGIPPFLKEEVLTLGLPVLSSNVASLETEGTMDDTMRLNLFIRTGQRVLFLLEEFRAQNPDELYSQLSRIAWEEYIYEDGYLCVTSSVDNPTIKDSRFANVKSKDAIVDRIKKRRGRRPDSGPERTGAVIDLYWKEDCARFTWIPPESRFTGADTGRFPSKPPCRKRSLRPLFWRHRGMATATS